MKHRWVAVAPWAAVACAFVAACSSDESGSPAVIPEAGTTDAATDALPTDSGPTDSGISDSPADSDADATTGGLDPGPYSLAYAGQIVGIDSRTASNGKATFDGSKLTGYEADGVADEHPTAGTNTVSNVASTNRYAMGRWAGGTTDGKFYNAGTGGKMTFAANGGFQYVIGVPADPLPTSGATALTLENKTVATVSDGSSAPGTVSGTAAATYAGTSTKIALSLSLDVPGDATYTAETTGGTANPALSEITASGASSVKGAFFFSKTIVSTGAACSGGATCTFAVNGFVGKNGDFVALVAHVYAGSGGSPKSVSGAIVFKK